MKKMKLGDKVKIIKVPYGLDKYLYATGIISKTNGNTILLTLDSHRTYYAYSNELELVMRKKCINKIWKKLYNEQNRNW